MSDGEPRESESEEIVSFTHRCYRLSRQSTAEWREEAPKWYDLVANKQWDEADIERLEAQKRIPVVINRVARALNAILGTQISNRQETRFIPREEGDVKVNEILTGAAEWVRSGCNAEDEESDAFEDSCICGMGFTSTRMDYDLNQEGSMVIERIDPLEMHWDPGAKKKNLSDAKWVMRIAEYGPDDFKARWPDADIDLAGAPWDTLTAGGILHRQPYPQDAYEKQQDESGTGSKLRKLLVAHIQWASREPVYRVGEKAETLNRSEFQRIEQRLKDSGIPHHQQTKVVWKQAFVAGQTLLESMDCPFPKGPTFRAITYKRDRNKNTWYGIVAAMMDPQKYGNKFLSLIMDILLKNSKGGVMLESDAVDSPKEIESKWAQPDALIVLRPGALSQKKVLPKPLASLPAGLDRLVAYFLDSVHEVTGISLELLGMANREQAGILEHQRKQAGVTIIAPLFDGLRRYRKEQGQVLLYFIQNFLSDGRLIRITGQGGEQYVPLVKQPETAEFDVIVDEAPASPNMKERTFAAISELMPVLAKLGIPMPPELLDYTPLPSSLIAKWKELLQNSPANPEQVQQMQEELQKLAQENAQLKDKRQESAMKLQTDQQEAMMKLELEKQKMLMEFEIAQEKMKLERMKIEQQIQLDREKAETELLLQKHQADQEMSLAQEKASNDFTIKRAGMINGAGLLEYQLGDGRTVQIERSGEQSKARIVEPKRAKSIRFNRAPDGGISEVDLDGQKMIVARDPKTGEIIELKAAA